MTRMLEWGFGAAAVAHLCENCDDENPELGDDPYIIENNCTEDIAEYIDAIDGRNLERLTGLLVTDKKNRQHELSLACDPNEPIL